MSHTRRLAFVAGALYLLTVVTSIPALALKDPVLADPATAAGGATALQWAAALEFVLALACIGTAVALFPVVRRVDEATALGFVGSRTLEASIIVTGILAMLSVTVAGPAAQALVRVHDWAFLVGPGTIPAVNALLLAPLFLRANLVPRVLPILGLIGAPLLLAASVGVLFGVIDQVSPVGFLSALLIAAWEIGLGFWLDDQGLQHRRREPALRPGEDGRTRRRTLTQCEQPRVRAAAAGPHRLPRGPGGGRRHVHAGLRCLSVKICNLTCHILTERFSIPSRSASCRWVAAPGARALSVRHQPILTRASPAIGSCAVTVARP